MATETTNETPEPKNNEQLLVWLSAVGGIGITLIVVALAVGVVNADANASAVGMAVLVGFALIVTAVGGWVIIEQPHKNFDDINVPQYHGHHHDDDHHDDDHAEDAHEESEATH